MSHVVIAGPGRSGTSFLMRWLHACGADTGPETSWHPEVRAGFETRFCPVGPRIQKDPWLFAYIGSVRPTDIDRLVLPVRGLDEIAQSRINNEESNAPKEHLHLLAGSVYGSAPGGAIYDLSLAHQEDMAARALYIPVEWAARHHIPVTILHHNDIFNFPERLYKMFRDEVDVIRPVAVERWKNLLESS